MQAKPELFSLLCCPDLLLSVKIVFEIQKSDFLFRREYFSVCLVCFQNLLLEKMVILDCFKACFCPGSFLEF